MKGRPALLRKWPPSENMVVHGKFRRGWLELKGLPFHLWDEDQLKFILKKWERVTKVARETLKLLDLTKVKLWVEMLPNVVLPALLEVEDGAWTYIVAILVIGEDDEDDVVTSETTRSRNEWVKARGCVSQSTKIAEGLRGSIRDNECYRRRLLPWARYRRSSTSLAAKRENGRGRSSLGLAEENFIGPLVPELSIKAQPERAQSGMRICGLHAGLDAPQAHQIVAASSPSLHRVGSSAKVIVLLCPGDERADVEAIFGEEGRAFELKAQSLSNPSPASDTAVGCKLKGPSGLGQNLGGTKPSGMEVWSRREENVARKGKAPVVQMRDSTQEEEKKMWSTLFSPSVDRRQGRRSSSEPILLRGSSSSSEVLNLEVDFETRS